MDEENVSFIFFSSPSFQHSSVDDKILPLQHSVMRTLIYVGCPSRITLITSEWELGAFPLVKMNDRKLWNVQNVNCENVKTFTLQEAQFCSWTRRIVRKLPSNHHNYHHIIIILCTISSRHLSSFSCPYHLIHLTHTSYFSLFVILHFSLFIPPTSYIIALCSRHISALMFVDDIAQ